LYEVAPRLTDGTVVIDAFQPEDADSHLAGEDEEQARRFGWFPRRSTLAGVRATIARWHDHWLTQGPLRAFALRLVDSEELVGGCELRLGDGGMASMSYWTFPVFRQRGLATRGVVLVTRYAFDTLGVTEIEVEIEPDNVASRGVAQRAGFADAGTIHASPGGRYGAANHAALCVAGRTYPPASRAPVDRRVRGLRGASAVEPLATDPPTAASSMAQLAAAKRTLGSRMASGGTPQPLPEVLAFYARCLKRYIARELYPVLLAMTPEARPVRSPKNTLQTADINASIAKHLRGSVGGAS
jgi:RimJ/RimL family protein N-acetyltransferase